MGITSGRTGAMGRGAGLLAALSVPLGGGSGEQ